MNTNAKSRSAIGRRRISSSPELSTLRTRQSPRDSRAHESFMSILQAEALSKPHLLNAGHVWQRRFANVRSRDTEGATDSFIAKVHFQGRPAIFGRCLIHTCPVSGSFCIATVVCTTVAGVQGSVPEPKPTDTGNCWPRHARLLRSLAKAKNSCMSALG
jgi:hypothetical protein